MKQAVTPFRGFAAGSPIIGLCRAASLETHGFRPARTPQPARLHR